MSKGLAIFRELGRYLLASLLALAVDMGVFSLCLRVLSLPWYWAATAGFVVGAATAYLLSIRFVFRARRLRHTPRSEFFAFVLIGLLGLLITQLVLYVGIELLRVHAELTRFVAACVTFGFNYGVRKLLLFHSSARVT